MQLTDITIDLTTLTGNEKVELKNWLNSNSNFTTWTIKDLSLAPTNIKELTHLKYLEYMSDRRKWVLSDKSELINKIEISYKEFKTLINK